MESNPHFAGQLEAAAQIPEMEFKGERL